MHGAEPLPCKCCLARTVPRYARANRHADGIHLVMGAGANPNTLCEFCKLVLGNHRENAETCSLPKLDRFSSHTLRCSTSSSRSAIPPSSGSARFSTRADPRRVLTTPSLCADSVCNAPTQLHSCLSFRATDILNTTALMSDRDGAQHVLPSMFPAQMIHDMCPHEGPVHTAFSVPFTRTHPCHHGSAIAFVIYFPPRM